MYFLVIGKPVDSVIRIFSDWHGCAYIIFSQAVASICLVSWKLCGYVCVRPPRGYKYPCNSLIRALYIWLNAFQFKLMALAVTIMYGHGPSNEMHRQF